MSRSYVVMILLGLVGCARGPAEPSSTSPQVQPESAATSVAPFAPTVQALGNAQPAAPSPAAPAAPSPTSAQRFGEPITLTETTALSDIVRSPAQYANQTVRTEGVVSAVCQARGCWMQIADGDNRVHVRMHGHSFFVPRTSAGHRARVQATVLSGLPNGHCEQEATEQTGHQARLELDALGIELD